MDPNRGENQAPYRYCRRGVILVTIEYRCGIFGLFAHPWLSVESERHISSKYGLMDQIAALRWVYENIGAYCGDRTNITVFGQSASAMSVQILVLSPLTDGMITKMIMQSGGSYNGRMKPDTTLQGQHEEVSERYDHL